MLVSIAVARFLETLERPQRVDHTSTQAMGTRLIPRAFHDPIFAKRSLKHVSVLQSND